MPSLRDKSPAALCKAVLRRAGQPLASLARNVAGSIRSVETRRPVVALTFDDGPHPETTPRVLELLGRHGARATFFMIGRSAMAYPAVVRAAAQEGHAIGNHSWSHLSFPLLGSKERLQQLRACEEILAPYGQKLFRPPYGHQTWSCRWESLRMGYDVVAFDVHAEDWLDRDPSWMAAQLVRKIRPGSIVILHDNIYHNVLANGHRDRAPMLQALGMMLERLEGRFEFVTVPDLLRHGRAVRDNWYAKSPAELEPALRRYVLAEASAGEAVRRYA